MADLYECAYCGERIGSGKYCSNCRTQDGRKKIFEENIKISKELKEKGYNGINSLRNPK